VLKSRPLRMYANYISYADKSFATEQAYLIGRLHCNMPHWDRSNQAFLLSGGFVISNYVSQLSVPTLVLWGADDKILDIRNAFRFEQALPDGELQLISNCGHVPHIEQATLSAEYIMNFLKKRGL
jgi:pimeloyl-ACP methyl ester carboxylesterase